MSGFLKQKVDGFRQRLRSWSFGIVYLQSSTFQIPESIKVNGKRSNFKFINRKDSGFQYEFTEICINDCYTLGQLSTCLGHVRNVVDVGANQGIFLIAARQAFPRARITGYEPNPNLEPFLTHNAGLLKAEIHYEAVTSKDCLMQLNFSKSDLETTVAVDANGSTIGTSLKKVKDRLQGPIDILKLDCEGGEWDLLGESTHWADVRSVTMEYHLWAKAGSTAEDVIKRLEELGFRILKHQKIEPTFGLLTACR